MPQLSVCFAFPTSVRTNNVRLADRNIVTVCAQSEQASASTTSTPKENKLNSLKAEQTSRSYKVLPLTLPAQALTESPRIHWRPPLIGFVTDHWIGNSQPVLAKKYGSIYKSSFVSEPMHFITDMDAISEIHNNSELFTSKKSLPSFEAIFGENSLFLIDGIDHAVLRSTIAPAFKPSVFPFLFDNIRARAEQTWASVERNVQENGKALLDTAFRRNYLSMVVEMTTGVDMSSAVASTLVPRFFRMANAFFSSQFGPWWTGGLAARAELLAILEGVIHQNLSEKQGTIDKLREYGDQLSFKSTKDLKKGDVNVLLIALAGSNLQTGPGVENDRAEVRTIADLMLLLWFAGYATSAATTACTTFEMGMDKFIWGPLVEEQDALVQAAGGARAVTYDQVASQMPLLDLFITEILRVHPAAAGALRVAEADVSILGKYVAAGDKLFLDYAGAMRDPRKYPDPDTLKMDRFLQKKGKAAPTRAISFGAPGSPHYCIGAALAKILIRTTLAVLFREYNMTLDPRQSRKYAIIPDNTPRSKVVVIGMGRRR